LQQDKVPPKLLRYTNGTEPKALSIAQSIVAIQIDHAQQRGDKRRLAADAIAVMAKIAAPIGRPTNPMK
jgi:hypothetical protein